MRYAFFMNTPAHVHLYRHVAQRLSDAGHTVRVFARDYGCTLDLVEYFDLPYECYGKLTTSKWSLARRLPGHYYNIFRGVREYDPDCIFGRGAYGAHAGAVTGAAVVLVLDSEVDTFGHDISVPFADVVLTPSSFSRDLGSNHYRFNGFKESAYLHPAVFNHDPSVRAELGIDSDEPFAIVRLNAFGSHHDVGQRGFSRKQRRELLEHLSKYVTVFVSDEGGQTQLSGLDVREYDLHPARIHDALAEAQLLVADTQTMVTEAALLGTPAIRSNSFVGENDMGNFVRLGEAGLVYNMTDFDEVINQATALVSKSDGREQWRERRDAFVADMVNLTDLLVDIANHLENVDDVAGLATTRSPASPT